MQKIRENECENCRKIYLQDHPGRRWCSEMCKFLSQIEKNNCWIWKGGLGRHGYAQHRMNNTPIVAYRAAWILFKGEIPKGICVCHRCDNKKCVNPDHLFLGTQSDNMKDMLEKGRRRKDLKGQDVPHSRLKDKDIKDIFEMRKNRYKIREIAEVFKVHKTHIGKILQRKKWKHIEVE